MKIERFITDRPNNPELLALMQLLDNKNVPYALHSWHGIVELVYVSVD